MSKQIVVAGKKYDSRTVVSATEKLKLPNHPKVSAIAMPKTGEEGKLVLIVKIPFDRLGLNTKEIHLEIPSPRRIDAINKVVEALKLSPMYRRIA